MIDDLQVYSDLDRLNGDNPAHDDNPDTPLSLMRRQMQVKAYEKVSPYRVHIHSGGEPHFFDWRTYKGVLILGAFTWTAPNEKEKWMRDHWARDIGAGVWVTPGDIARIYLGLKYPNRRVKMTTEQYKVCVKAHYYPPRYAAPTLLENGAVYFDLSGAYWQIVRACGWDADYLPGQFLGRNSDMTDFPFRHEKMARNCLVSVGDSSEMNLWTGSRIIWQKSSNPFVNKVLWRLVCDVLHGVACDCLRAGANYIYTDGYICSAADSSAVAEAIMSWGLRFGIKAQGERGEIRAPASYLVGDYVTKPYRDSTRAQSFSNLYDPGCQWLRPRFRKLVELADRDWLFYEGMEGYDE